MRLFIKYILRGLKKSAIQPIIIIITLICSIITMMSSTKIVMDMQDELLQNQIDWYDIEVNLSSQSDVRVLFDDDTKKAVGDNGSVLGEFYISGLIDTKGGKELINLSATDIISADEFQNFKFTHYGQITDRNLNESIILSHDAAERYALKIGDNISIYMLGKRFDLSVEAIALSEGILHKNIGVINIGAVISALAEINPMISHIDRINPYSSLKIRLNDSTKINEYKSIIAAIPSLSTATVLTNTEKYKSDYFMHTTSFAVITTTTMIVVLLASIIVASSFDILNKKRRKDRALFMICGASSKALRQALILELFIYGAVAIILSMTIAFPIYRAFNEFYGYTESSYSPIALLVSAAACFLLLLTVALLESKSSSTLCVSDLLSEAELTTKHKLSAKRSLFLALLFFIGLLITFFANTNQRFYIYIILCALFFALIYFVLPYILNLISAFATKAMKRFRRVPTKLMLGFKHLYSSYSLMHATRLISLLSTILLLIFICLNTLSAQIAAVNTAIDCNYISLAADKKAAQIIENIEGVDSAFYISLSHEMLTEANTGLFSISASDEAFEFINPAFMPVRNPHGNEVVISSGVSNLCSKKIGDEIVLTHKATPYTFKIIDVIKTSANLVIYDSGYIGETNELLCIRTSESAGPEQLKNISNALEARGASIVKSEAVLQPITRQITSYSKMIRISVYIAIITTSLGIANIFISSFLSKKREREIYYLVGMTKKEIFKSGMIEIFCCATTAVIISCVLLPLALWLLDSALISWGVDLI